MLKILDQFEGEDYVTLEFMLPTDQIGRDYTVYCIITDEKAETFISADQEPEPASFF